VPLLRFSITRLQQLFSSKIILLPVSFSVLIAGCTHVPLSTDKSPPASPNTATSTKQTSPEKTLATPPVVIRDPVLDGIVLRQERIYRIAAPLIIKNAVLCKTQARPLLGFTAKNQYSFPPELTVAAQQSLGLDERLQVMQILDGSGAMQAGLKRGDILHTIQDQRIPTGAQAEPETARLLPPLLKNLTEIKITVLRQSQQMTVNVPLTLACAFAIDVGNSQHINAYADGRRILLTRGLLDSLSSDEDVAVIIAREISHNILQHAKQLQQTATLSSVIDSLLAFKPDLNTVSASNGIKVMPEKMDQEADRLALYMLARANYDPANFSRVLKRLAQTSSTTQTNTYQALHPWTEERQNLILSTLKEIRQKQSTKKVLVP
jgi:Zn-dependent protease with chaperone function